MDTLTHALSGALAVQALGSKVHPDRRVLRRFTVIGFLCAAAPDLDFILSFVNDDPLTYLRHHRGVTHSLLLLPLWAGVLGGLFKLIFRDLPYRRLYGVCALSIGLHIAGDVITSYGTMIFAPYSNWRAALDTTFIIDPIFSGIIIVGLILAAFRRTQVQLPKFAALTLVGYIGLQGWAQHQAKQIGEHWAAQQGMTADVHALPQPLSPLHWKLIAIGPDDYHLSYLKLFGEKIDAESDSGFLRRLASIYQPAAQLDWRHYARPDSNQLSTQAIRDAWQHPVLADYRDFARYPVYTNIPSDQGQCIGFRDLQFQFPGRNNPFTFGVCNNPISGQVTLARFR